MIEHHHSEERADSISKLMGFGPHPSDHVDLTRGNHNNYRKAISKVSEYRTDGIKHFSSQHLPVDILNSLLNHIGAVKLITTYKSGAVLPINFDFLIFEEDLLIDGAGFLSTFLANKSEIKRAFFLIKAEFGGLEIAAEIMSSMLGRTPDADDIYRLLREDCEYQEADYKLIEAMVRFNCLINQIGAIHFHHNAEKIVANSDPVVSELCRNHSFGFFNTNIKSVGKWVKKMRKHTACKNNAEYMLIHMNLDHRGIGEDIIKKVAGGNGSLSDDYTVIARQVTLHVAAVAAEGYQTTQSRYYPF